MSGELVFLVHPDENLVDQLSESLHMGNFKVLSMRSDQEAEEVITNFRYVLPDVLLTPLDDPSSDDTILLKLLQASPLMEQVPVVILASGDQEQRRRALRLGLTNLIFPPYDTEEVVLTTRLALDRHRDERRLFGSLSQLSVCDLLQTIEVGRRSGTIVLRNRGTKGHVWFRDGVIIDGELDDGRQGEEAVYTVAIWAEGTFEADFGPVARPERISLSPSSLLLEAMRRLDEAKRDASLPEEEDDQPPVHEGAVVPPDPDPEPAPKPPAAVVPVRPSSKAASDPFPSVPAPSQTPAAVIPTRPSAARALAPPAKRSDLAVAESEDRPVVREQDRTVHVALALMNISASYCLQFLAPQLLQRRLESFRDKLKFDHPELKIFRVAPGGAIAIAFDETVIPDPQGIVDAVTAWLQELMSYLDEAMPGRFTAKILSRLMTPLADDALRLGFAKPIGLEWKD